MSARPVGALVCLALLFVGSATARLGATQAERISDLLTSSVPPPRVEAINPIPEAVALLENLKRREQALDAREAEIETRQAALSLIEKGASTALRQLEEAEQALRQTMSIANEASETDLSRLTAMYQEMKPAQASELFRQMTPSFAAGFLARMRPDAAAAVLSGLEPEQAYAISVVLAGRHADVPVEPLPE